MPTTSSRPDARAAASRRSILIGLAAAGVSACTSDPNSSTAALSKLVLQSVDPFSKSPALNLQEVASVPYASIGVRVGDSSQFMLVLASRTGRDLLWTSVSRIAIETRSGRITTTAGLKFNLTATNFAGIDPLSAEPHKMTGTPELRRVLDFADRSLFSVPVLSKFEMLDTERIDILGSAIVTRHVRETCSCEQLDWAFANDFWVDPYNGRVWRSVQCIHPALDPIAIETLRPAPL